MKTAAEESSSRFRGHSAAELLGIVGAILEGEILRADDELERAIAEKAEMSRHRINRWRSDIRELMQSLANLKPLPA